MGYILVNFEGLTSEQGYRVKERFREFLEILREYDGLSKDSFSGWCSLYVPCSGEDYSDVREVTESYDEI